MEQSEKHILVIRLSALGDVAMTVPVLRALLSQNKNLKISIATKRNFVPLFKDLKGVNVIPVDPRTAHKGLPGLFRLAKQLNKEYNFYAIADLHKVLRSQILKKFIRSTRFITIDKGRPEKKALTEGQIFKPLKSTHERYADVFRGLGYKVDLSNPQFPLPKNLSERVSAITGEKDKKWIGIAPFAAHEGKMYPLDLMEKVIQELYKENSILLFGGGAEEVAFLEQLSKKYDNVINLSGKLSLHNEMDIISNLDIMLSMDSGNAHIAAMQGVKVVTIWGVTHPYAGFAPFNQPVDYMLLADRNRYPKIPTSVYGKSYPEEYKFASASIRPETVITKVLSVL